MADRDAVRRTVGPLSSQGKISPDQTNYRLQMPYPLSSEGHWPDPQPSGKFTRCVYSRRGEIACSQSNSTAVREMSECRKEAIVAAS
jgi:hypothetical protein